MKIHPDVLAAHAQFGGDLELMQKAYEHPDLVAEITRLRAALADERKRALEEAADRIKEFAVAMGRIAEHRKANQQLAQAAIDTLEVIETLVRALKEYTK